MTEISHYADAAHPSGAVVGEVIHLAMWRKRVSQRQLAKDMGISQSNLSKKLRGEVAITMDDLAQFSAALAVPVVELLPQEWREAPTVTVGASRSQLPRLDSNQQPSG